ncbi:phage shock protein C, PspC [Paenibacillus sp. FSL R7-277]|nr:phage shock protein C, PspC [Paenibacillus sp. FSL R7-277]
MRGRYIMNKKLTRSVTDKKLTGLCGGLARYFKVDATLVRLIVAIATIFSFGTVVFLYIIGSLIVPQESYGGFDDGFNY